MSEIADTDPRVKVDTYRVYPSCYDQMGNSDRDYFCLEVTDGHAWGWSVRRSGGGPMAMNRKGEFIYESRGSERNKWRRWTLDEALTLALKYVDQVRLNGSTAADCAARWPRDPDPTPTPATSRAATKGGGL